MDYFDETYFDETYFDTPDGGDVATSSHRVGITVMRPPVESDEADDLLAAII